MENSSHAPGHEIEMGSDGVRQRKMMASGDGPMSGGNFGVGSIPGTRTAGRMGGTWSKTSDGEMCSDKERCRPIKSGGMMMHAQAHPDHGSMR
jgi:hypothetical protein